MTRAEIWLAQVDRKRRPVLVLTRPEVIDGDTMGQVCWALTYALGC